MGIKPAPAIFFIAGQRPSAMVPVMRAPARLLARVASLRCYGYVRSLSGQPGPLVTAPPGDVSTLRARPRRAAIHSSFHWHR